MIVVNKPFYKKIDINFIGNTKSYIKKNQLYIFIRTTKKLSKEKIYCLTFPFLGEEKAKPNTH